MVIFLVSYQFSFHCFSSFIQGTPGSLFNQLSLEQQQELADQEDHGFTDDSWLPSNLTHEHKDTLEGAVENTDTALCHAIEKTFLEVTNVAVVKQHNCEQ